MFGCPLELDQFGLEAHRMVCEVCLAPVRSMLEALRGSPQRLYHRCNALGMSF